MLAVTKVLEAKPGEMLRIDGVPEGHGPSRRLGGGERKDSKRHVWCQTSCGRQVVAGRPPKTWGLTNSHNVLV